MSDYDGSGGGMVCCRCCLTFLLTSALAAVFLWLSLRTSNPICSIQDVYIPALNKTLNSTSYQSIYLDLKLDNQNKDKGVYYDPINVTLRYYQIAQNQTRISIPISNYTLFGFYQGHNKNARRKNWIESHGVPWGEAAAAVGGGGAAVFRVDLATVVRFRILVWKTKRKKLVVGADVEVNDSGQKVKKKGTRLKSGAPELVGRRDVAGVLLVLLLFSI